MSATAVTQTNQPHQTSPIKQPDVYKNNRNHKSADDIKQYFNHISDQVNYNKNIALTTSYCLPIQNGSFNQYTAIKLSCLQKNIWYVDHILCYIVYSL